MARKRPAGEASSQGPRKIEFRAFIGCRFEWSKWCLLRGGEAFSNRQQTDHGIHRSRAGSVALALMLCWSGSVCTETFNQFLKIPTCARGLGRLVGRHPEQKQEAREGGESVVPFRSALTVSIVPALASSFLHLLQVPALSQPIGVHPPYLARSWRARRCISRRVFPTSPEFSCHSFHVPCSMGEGRTRCLVAT